MRKATREALLAAGAKMAAAMEDLAIGDGYALSNGERCFFDRRKREWDAAVSQYRNDIANSKRPKKKAKPSEPLMKALNHLLPKGKR